MWPPTAIRRRTPTRGMNTHPWAAAPTAPTTADTADDSRPDLLPKRECKIPLTSTGLPSQQRLPRRSTPKQSAPAHALFRAGGPDEENAGGGPAASRIPVPALGERQHGCLAGWLVAVGGCAVFVVAVGEGPDPRELCVSGQHDPTDDAVLANDVVHLTGTCRSALEEEVGHGDDMMRPLRSGAKANAAGSALRPPLPSLNSVHAPVASAYLAHRLHPAVPAHKSPTTARRRRLAGSR